MKLNKLFLLLLPLSLVACNNTPKEPEKPDPSLLTTPLCMTCTSDSMDGLLNIFHSTIYSMDDFSLQYSKDNKTWHDVEFTYRQSTFLLRKDETIYFRGNNPEGFNHAHIENSRDIFFERVTMFAANSPCINLGGNVMSLLSPTEFDKLTDIPCDYCFTRLFNNYGVKGIPLSLYKDASKLSLPATKLKPGCYADMFMGNNLLEIAPILPAVTLAKDCYAEMFVDCGSLKKLQVSFDESAFVADYPFTTRWLGTSPTNEDEQPIFIWSGNEGGFERNESTVPSNWVMQKTPTEVF